MRASWAAAAGPAARPSVAARAGAPGCTASSAWTVPGVPSAPTSCRTAAAMTEVPSSAGKARRRIPSVARGWLAGVKPSRNRMAAASEKGPAGVRETAVTGQPPCAVRV